MTYRIVATAETYAEVKNAYDYGRFLPLENNQVTYTPTEDSDGKTRIIYIAAEDKAGNVTFAATEGFTVDMQKPVVTMISPEEKVLSDNSLHICCAPEIVFSVSDVNFDRIETQQGVTLTQDANGNYHLFRDPGYSTQYIAAVDKAGTETLVNFALYDSHNFNEAGICTQCGKQAVAKLTLGETTMMFVSGDELFDALAEETTYDGASVTLLQDITLTENVAVKSDVRIDLNGKALGGRGISIYGEVTINSTGSKGNITSPIAVQPDAELTMGEGLGTVSQLLPLGKINVYSGDYAALSSFRTPNIGTEAGVFKLYGGHFRSIPLRTADLRDILAAQIVGRNKLIDIVRLRLCGRLGLGLGNIRNLPVPGVGNADGLLPLLFRRSGAFMPRLILRLCVATVEIFMGYFLHLVLLRRLFIVLNRCVVLKHFPHIGQRSFAVFSVFIRHTLSSDTGYFIFSSSMRRARFSALVAVTCLLYSRSFSWPVTIFSTNTRSPSVTATKLNPPGRTPSPPGPARPVVDIAISAPLTRFAPRAISRAVCSLTAPYVSRVSGETPKSFIFMSLE